MNGDEKTLEKVRALLLRAGHPNTPEEEARTSGILAARMMYAYGFEVRLSGASVNARQAEPPPEERRREEKLYRTITSKFDGWCKGCNQPFDVGEVVAWMKGRGCTHYDCRAFWDKT